MWLREEQGVSGQDNVHYMVKRSTTFWKDVCVLNSLGKNSLRFKIHRYWYNLLKWSFLSLWLNPALMPRKNNHWPDSKPGGQTCLPVKDGKTKVYCLVKGNIHTSHLPDWTDSFINQEWCFSLKTFISNSCCRHILNK